MHYYKQCKYIHAIIIVPLIIRKVKRMMSIAMITTAPEEPPISISVVIEAIILYKSLNVENNNIICSSILPILNLTSIIYTHIQ